MLSNSKGLTGTFKRLFALVLSLSFMSPILGSSFVQAEETLGEKVENKVDDVKKDTKQAVRKGKRKHRNATGNGNILKDAGDKINDASDEVTTAAKKAKRKVD